LCTMPVVAQLIGEEPRFDLRQNRCFLPLKQLTSTPEKGVGQMLFGKARKIYHRVLMRPN
jgi:hypothetical protein